MDAGNWNEDLPENQKKTKKIGPQKISFID